MIVYKPYLCWDLKRSRQERQFVPVPLFASPRKGHDFLFVFHDLLADCDTLRGDFGKTTGNRGESIPIVSRRLLPTEKWLLDNYRDG